MTLKIPVIVLMVFSAVCPGSALALTSVTDEVKKIVDEVVAIVSDRELQKPENEPKRQKALKHAISAIFDYAEMARRSMGRHWMDRTPDEQKEFVRLFETLLENSYAGAIESYSDEKIVYLKETVDKDYAEVNSKVVTAKRDEYSIDYRLMNKGGRWVIYDVVNEGVSLVDNYKTQFNKIIKNEGYAGLVKKLKSKSAEITAPRKDLLRQELRTALTQNSKLRTKNSLLLLPADRTYRAAVDALLNNFRRRSGRIVGC